MASFSWQSLSKPFFVLAPMEDVTDTVFRRIIDSLGSPDVYFTEFTNCEGLLSVGGKHVAHRLKYTEKERPLIAQIWGTKPEQFFEVAKKLVAMGFDGIDLNMGCPEKSVLKIGACSALINNHGLAKEIIQATKEGANAATTHPDPLPKGEGEHKEKRKLIPSPSREKVRMRGSIPVSVKTRIGYKTLQTEKWLSFLLEQDIAALSVHGRTVAELSLVPAHWEEIGKAVQIRNELNKQTVVIGNGDVSSYDDGVKKAEKYHLDGIMVGRGVFHNPWLFDRSVDPTGKSEQERLELLLRHVNLFDETWGKNKNYHILKKYFKIYVQGFDGASDLRAKLMQTNSADETRELVSNLLNHKS